MEPVKHTVIGLGKAGAAYKVVLTDHRFLHHVSITYDDKINIVKKKFYPYSIIINLIPGELSLKLYKIMDKLGFFSLIYACNTLIYYWELV